LEFIHLQKVPIQVYDADLTNFTIQQGLLEITFELSFFDKLAILPFFFITTQNPKTFT